MTSIDLALISHTNVGKTTLARTLLRRDVGDVLDRAHVTEESEVFSLLTVDEDELRLWDTPGFGDSARLLRRLKAEKNPMGWFLHQVWDRFADRPLWCSQQAARTIRDDADVVLYLVNAAEAPEDAGYARLEMELLSWIGRPVLILLNQVGDAAPSSRPAAALEEAWETHSATWPVVRGVLSLDAFTRCWVEEGVLLSKVAEVLDGEQGGAMERLAGAWRQRNQEVFRRSVGRLGEYLARGAADGETLSGSRASRAEKKRAMESLAERLEGETRELMDAMIRDHGLEGRSSRALDKRIDAFLVSGTTELSTQQGALVGGVVSGALGGLAADLLSGGLTFGGGMVAGAILGALGGVGLSRAHELVRLGGKPGVRWSPDFLAELTQQAMLRYLAVAHFGRGRGDFEDREHPEHWKEAVAEAVEAQGTRLQRIWKEIGEDAEEAPSGRSDLEELLQETLVEILARAYPEAARSLREMPSTASDRS